ncbi:MAG: hypothetical protein ACOCV2_03850 [Persicimonas sp.]
MNAFLCYQSRHLTAFSLGIILLAGALVVGCSDDTTGGEDCDPGERYNELTGECEEQTRAGNSNSSNDNNGPDDDDDAGTADDADDENDGGEPDASPADDTDLDEDPDADRCDPEADSDGDGLSNECECELGTHPYEADTDDDGLDDGEEDANQNCEVDPGETDPNEADTDVDGLDDGEELEEGTDPLSSDSDDDGVKDGAEVDSGCMDPLDEDTDGDGLLDGVEDGDGDGELGECEDRDYEEECAQGESDPCSTDTDGDGTPDSEEVAYRNCRPEDTENLSEPDYVESSSGDYKLAVESSVDDGSVSFSSGSGDAHVFEDDSHDYTGFVASLQPPNSMEDPGHLADEITSRVQGEFSSASRRSSGRQITTHDEHKGLVGGITELPAGTDLAEARDRVLAATADVSESDLSHSLSDSMSGISGEPTLFVHQVVSRSANEYVVVGAFVSRPNYRDNTQETGFRVDDLTGGASLASNSETLEEDCVSYEVEAEPEVDIIISLDASGSMEDEQDALSGFATEFSGLLDDANVDWRVGVTSVDCSDIKEDTALSSDYRDMWPDSDSGGIIGDLDGVCGDEPFSGSGGNGELVGGDFTDNPTTIGSRLDSVDTSNSEYTLTMAAAGADRALPRTDGDAAKFREDASVILISVTDEEDEFFKQQLDFLGGDTSLSASEQDDLEDETEPWIDFLLGDEIGATVFGLFWPPGESCDTAADVAHAIADVVDETGGNGGSVCQPDITNTLRGIADATAGIASGLRIRGTAAPQTMTVDHASMDDGTIEEMDRSRDEGFDYDPIVNRVNFRGSDTPETGDRVVIPYLRWADSVSTCVDDADCPHEQKMICVDGECR